MDALTYGVPLEVRIHEACLDIVGVAVSGAVNSLVKAVGVLVPLFSTDLLLGPHDEGSSVSFSARGVRPFRIDEEPSLW